MPTDGPFACGGRTDSTDVCYHQAVLWPAVAECGFLSCSWFTCRLCQMLDAGESFHILLPWQEIYPSSAGLLLCICLYCTRALLPLLYCRVYGANWPPWQCHQKLFISFWLHCGERRMKGRTVKTYTTPSLSSDRCMFWFSICVRAHNVSWNVGPRPRQRSRLCHGHKSRNRLWTPRLLDDVILHHFSDLCKIASSVFGELTG